jgi:hypothetical protein
VAVAKTTASSSTVPLVVCRTSSGINLPAKHLPRTATVTVPGSLGSQLSAYTNNQGDVPVLAPRGWACQAEVGGDSSESITVFPRGVPQPTQPWPRQAEAVTSEVVPACVGCYLTQACTFFPSANKTLRTDFGPTIKCPRRPAREAVERLSATVVEFSDPPGVMGTSGPSGGAYPALGVVTYKAQTTQASYGSWMETCTLPTSEHSLCTAAVNEFVTTWYSSITPPS